MRTKLFAALPAVIVALTWPAFAQELPVIHDMHYPDLNNDGTQVAFSYQGDIWVADLDGEGQGVARRLTVHSAYDARPRFSPDGKTIAFVSDRYGGFDVFLVPAEGGEIKRLTYHSASDTIADWSPDGKKVLFTASGRDHRYSCPYEIDIETGYVRPVFRDAFSVSATGYSLDARYVIGIRGGMEWWRKGYRGSANADVFVYDTQTDTMKMATDFPGADNWPVFSADATEIYYVSEREGRPNVFAQNLENGEIRAVTRLRDDAVTYLQISGDGKTLVFEYGFDLWTIDPRGGKPRKLEIHAPIDYRENFEGDTTLTSNVEEMEANRDGSWVAIRLLDDIFIVKPEFKNGSVRVTDWPGMDGDFYWHPNGKELAYISQENGTADIWVYNVDTKEKKCLVRDDSAYLDMMGYTWDGEKILFRKGQGGDGVYEADAETGEVTRFLTEPEVLDAQISPDGKWIAADINHPRAGRDIHLRPIDGGEWTNITNHPAGNASPRWSPDGKKLFFTSARTGAWQVYSVDLQRQAVEFDDYEAQFAEKEKAEKEKAAKEEKPAPEAAVEGETKPEGEQKPEEQSPEWKKKPIEPIAIDFFRIDKRLKRLTSSDTNESIVGFAGDGKTLVFQRGRQIWAMDLTGENQRQFVPGDYDLGNVRLTDDGKWLYFVGSGGIYKVDAVRGGGATPISFKAELDRDGRTLQKWAFRQAWALLDESFYSYNRHGVDWNAVYEHYKPYCDGTLVPEDFANLVSRMIGELNGSHLGCYAGGRGGKDTGRLGLVADPTHQGPGFKVMEVTTAGPCDQPEATVKVGEYVMAIDGQPVNDNEHVSELLTDKAGDRVKLLVNSEPKSEGAREVSIKPISGGALGGLQYDLWVEANRKMALDLSKGRVYYIHMNGMNGGTLKTLTDELLGPAQHYDAVIIDVRFNGGGYTHDSVLELLTKKVHGWQGVRGVPLRTAPGGQFDGPMCCLINQNSFSDAEIFPNGFREKGLGKLIGVPTAGGVIGTWDTTLVNGAGFRVPVVGWYRMDGISLENYGVPPDIYVPVPYETFRDGRDPQIEAAVKELLTELETKKRAEPPDVDEHAKPVLP